MAFPQLVGAVAHTHVTANATSITVALPDGSNVAGRLLIAAVSKDGTGTMTWPSDPAWTVLDAGNDGSAASRMEVRYHIVTGTETGWDGVGDTFLVTGASEEWAASVYLIKGHNSSTNPPEGTAATGTTGNMDPAAETASWGSADNLFIVFGTLDASVTVTGWPANYGSNQHGDNTGGTGGCSHGSASRELAASNDDPGTYTNGSESWRTLTVVVQPGSEGSVINQTIAATAIGVATVTTQTSHLLTIAATAVGVATLDASKLFLKAIDAVAVGVATVATSVVYGTAIAATAVGVATVSAAVTFAKAIAAVAVGIADVATLFIPGGGGGGGIGFRVLNMLKRLRRILG